LSDKPAPAKYEDLAGLIEYALIQPELSDEAVSRGCEIARQYQVASVIVRPSDVDLVARWIAGSGVRLGALTDSPHGYSTTAAKLFAARDLLRLGVQEIDTVMNTGKLISRQFQYLETELLQMADSCHQSGAVLAVNLETGHLTEELKIVACRVARRAGVDYIGANQLEDIALLQAHSRERLKIKTRPPIAALETALQLPDAACSRIQLAPPGAHSGSVESQASRARSRSRRELTTACSLQGKENVWQVDNLHAHC
jgi:deoxyribose-phosphate aldolase